MEDLINETKKLINEAKKVGVQTEEQFDAYVDLRSRYDESDANKIFREATRWQYRDNPFSIAVGGAEYSFLEHELGNDYYDEYDDWDDDGDED